jgi:hypothetical protein
LLSLRQEPACTDVEKQEEEEHVPTAIKHHQAGNHKRKMFASDNFELKTIAFELREFWNNLSRSLIYSICVVV